ncbi:dihydrofolate reductase [Rhodopirellula sp. P2]|uniref:dihydrofolate reductase n=1 Tax=Rhodopirellula sp. P2 TaxID=2127060 RepID=UPI0023684124|nr:dihydrofolate reductase [Rhodopirellula sp. P2]WDQ16627.1 dihydrofolate reductase [Rhodopirellula sp. P2]
MCELSSRPDPSPSDSSASSLGPDPASQASHSGQSGDAAGEPSRSPSVRDSVPTEMGPTDRRVGCRITAVVAATPDGVIGDEQDMPWRLSSDLKRFKQATMGGALIMGRKTFESIGRVLPGRQTIVLTRQDGWNFPGTQTASGASEAIAFAAQRRIFVVGGGQIYQQWFPLCTDLWWTRVWANLSGDTRIDLPLEEFELVSQTSFPVTAKDDYPTDWLRMRRRIPSPKLAGPNPAE